MNTTTGNNYAVTQPKMESVTCDLCGADDYQVLFLGRDRLHQKPGIFPVVKCRRCQLVYLNPRPADEILASYYPEDYSPFQRGGGITDLVQSWLRGRLARRIHKTIPLGSKILEIGCGTGDLLVPLRDASVRVAGIELSPHAAEFARSNYGLEIHTGTLFDAPYTPNSFDAVILHHVIEHFPSARLSLERIVSLLKPEGFLFISTPNYDSIDRSLFGKFWHNYETPRHQFIFSVNTLTKLLKESGFQLLRVQHSLLPNDWVHSIRNTISESLNTKLKYKFFSIKNPFILLLFLPFGILQKILKRSGRIEVLAQKKF